MSVASVLKSAARNASAALAPRRAPQTAQRFVELLIHRDEAGHMPFTTELSIAAPDTAWYAVDTLDSTAYRFSNTHYKKHGYRLRRVSSFMTRHGVRYAAIWEQAPGPEWHSVHGVRHSEFLRNSAEYARKGFRLAFVDVRQDYAAIWEAGDPGTQQVFTAITADELKQQLGTLASQGYRPARISGAAEDGTSRFAAIFEKDSRGAWQAHIQLNHADFNRMSAHLKAQGYRLTDASGHMVNRKPVFSGIWQTA